MSPVLNPQERIAQALMKMAMGTLGGRAKQAQPVVPVYVPRGAGAPGGAEGPALTDQRLYGIWSAEDSAFYTLSGPNVTDVLDLQDHATQPYHDLTDGFISGDTGPTIAAAAINGYDCFAFNGTNQSLSPAFPVAHNGFAYPVTIYMVVEFLTQPGADDRSYVFAMDVAYECWFDESAGTLNVGDLIGSPPLASVSGLSINTPYLIRFRKSPATGTSIYVGGVGDDTDGGNPTDNPTTALVLGAREATDETHCAMNLARVQVYHGAFLGGDVHAELDPTEDAVVRSFLATKYSVDA